MYVPPLPRDLDELGRRILEAAASVTADILERVWQDVECRIDVCHVTKGHKVYIIVLTDGHSSISYTFLKVFTSFVKTFIIPLKVVRFSSMYYSALFHNLKLSVTVIALASQVRASAKLILLNVRNSKLKHVPLGLPPVA